MACRYMRKCTQIHIPTTLPPRRLINDSSGRRRAEIEVLLLTVEVGTPSPELEGRVKESSSCSESVASGSRSETLPSVFTADLDLMSYN